MVWLIGEIEMEGIIEKGTRIDLELIDETIAYASGGAITFKADMPRDKDLIALGIDVNLNVDTDVAAPVKTDDHIFNVVDKLNTKLDGQPVLSLYDRELKWLHWFVWGKRPSVKETPTLASQTGKTAWARFLLPVMLPKSHKPDAKFTLTGTWGAPADLDSAAGFVINSGNMKVTAYKGRLSKAQRATGLYYTRRHSPQGINGDDELTIPAGLLRSIIMQITDRTDSINTVNLKHGGHYFIPDIYYEELVNYMKWKWGIDLVNSIDPALEKTTGLAIIDGQNLPVSGSNSKIGYNTSASKNLYFLYVLRGLALQS